MPLTTFDPAELWLASTEALQRLRQHLLCVPEPRPIKEKKLLRMIVRELIRRGVL